MHSYGFGDYVPGGSDLNSITADYDNLSVKKID